MSSTPSNGVFSAIFSAWVMKHLRTEVQGSRKRRVYDRAATPFERLKQSGKADPQKLAQLEKLFATGSLCFEKQY